MNSARRSLQRLITLRPMLDKAIPVPLHSRLSVSGQQSRLLSLSDVRMYSSGAGDTGFPVFNVQDEDDFKKRVLEAGQDKPVVVQFTAG